MAGCSIINYKEKAIFYFDHRGLGEADLKANLEAANKMIVESGQEEILTLANFTDVVTGKEAMAYLRTEESQEVNRRTKKSAVVGITGIKKILLNTYNSIIGAKAKAFNTEEEAKEYLIK